MIGNILRGLCVLLAVAMIVGAFIGSEGLADEETQSAMLPPCTVEEGLPFLQEEEVTCYWGMSEETLVLDEEIDLAEVLVEFTWEKSGVWIGIAEASEASKCTQRDGYYECDKYAVDLIAGGEVSNGQFTWDASSGEYRFVAGGDDVQSLQQFDVNWKYQATLPQSTTWSLLIIGAGLGLFTLLGWKRAAGILADVF